MKRAKIEVGMKVRILHGQKKGEIGTVEEVGYGQVDVKFLISEMRYYGYEDVESVSIK